MSPTKPKAPRVTLAPSKCDELLARIASLEYTANTLASLVAASKHADENLRQRVNDLIARVEARLPVAVAPPTPAQAPTDTSDALDVNGSPLEIGHQVRCVGDAAIWTVECVMRGTVRLVRDTGGTLSRLTRHIGSSAVRRVITDQRPFARDALGVGIHLGDFVLIKDRCERGTAHPYGSTQSALGRDEKVIVRSGGATITTPSWTVEVIG